jgi:hypothetical protein
MHFDRASRPTIIFIRGYFVFRLGKAAKELRRGTVGEYTHGSQRLGWVGDMKFIALASGW